MNASLTLGRLWTLLLGLTLASLPLAAQNDEAPVDSLWEKGGVASLGFNNTSFSTYWQAGGIPSQSLVTRLNVFANYKDKKQSWQNDLVLAYGLIRQGRANGETPITWIKNEDRIELNSKYGYNFTKNLLISSQLNFRSQFAPGFQFGKNNPTNIDSATQISDLFSPAYLNFGVGIDWQPVKGVSVYYSPVNSKITIVADSVFRSRYIPPSITTEPVRYELGSNLTLKIRRELMENVTFQTSANFFTNYLDNFGLIDVNWETLTTAKVNNWLALTFSTNLIYDDDIRFQIEDDDPTTASGGPRTQFQHVLTVALTYNFL